MIQIQTSVLQLWWVNFYNFILTWFPIRLQKSDPAQHATVNRYGPPGEKASANKTHSFLSLHCKRSHLQFILHLLLKHWCGWWPPYWIQLKFSTFRHEKVSTRVCRDVYMPAFPIRTWHGDHKDSLPVSSWGNLYSLSLIKCDWCVKYAHCTFIILYI